MEITRETILTQQPRRFTDGAEGAFTQEYLLLADGKETGINIHIEGHLGRNDTTRSFNTVSGSFDNVSEALESAGYTVVAQEMEVEDIAERILKGELTWDVYPLAQAYLDLLKEDAVVPDEEIIRLKAEIEEARELTEKALNELTANKPYPMPIVNAKDILRDYLNRYKGE